MLKGLYGQASSYIHEMSPPSKGRRYSMRSNKTCVPKITKFKRDTFYKRAFVVFGPLAWNCLAAKEIRLCQGSLKVEDHFFMLISQRLRFEFEELSECYQHSFEFSLSCRLKVTSHERHAVSNHELHIGPIVQQLVKANDEVLDLCERNAPMTVDSHHKGPIMRKAFPRHDVIIISMS